MFQNQFKEKVILEVLSRPSFKELFEKPRIKETLVQISKDSASEANALGLIVVANGVDNLKKHALEVGIPANVSEPKEQNVFAVREVDYEKVIPVLLVSILGSRASGYGRLS